MYNYYGDYFYPMHSFFGPIFMVIFWVLIIWMITRFVRHHPHPNVHHGKALDILKERYAKGEITKEQFEIMKKDIQ